MRCPNHCARRQGRRLRVLQKLPSRGCRADPHARLGARRDARMAPAIRQATVVNRLVWDACQICHLLAGHYGDVMARRRRAAGRTQPATRRGLGVPATHALPTPRDPSPHTFVFDEPLETTVELVAHRGESGLAHLDLGDDTSPQPRNQRREHRPPVLPARRTGGGRPARPFFALSGAVQHVR
jgi:hypothetical protein